MTVKGQTAYCKVIRVLGAHSHTLLLDTTNKHMTCLQTMYTVMFWVTLRQYKQEQMEQRNTSTIADMVAPLQLGVGAATTGTL